MTDHQLIIIGGGQAGLATAYYLKRAGIDFLILDAGEEPGGAWRHGWDSLRLFSPAAYSSLPGWQMPGGSDTEYPTRDDVIDYLTRYEARYAFPVTRPVTVNSVAKDDDGFVVSTDERKYRSRAVVSATGTWSAPFVPDWPGLKRFRGDQLHSAHYREPTRFRDKNVLVVGGGNSGAQIFAEVAQVASTRWVTIDEPTFLPDDVDGRVLFQRASARILGKDSVAFGGLGDIVMVPPVRAARDKGILGTVRPFHSFAEDGVVWPDGRTTQIDAVIWCTGFRPALDHLRGLGIVDADGKVATHGQQSTAVPGLWLMGYGNWTGAASATIIGAGRVAREASREIVTYLDGP